MKYLAKRKTAQFAIDRLLALAALSVLLSGCAGITHRSINSEKEDRQADGLRYFDSSPYLLVQTDNQGSLTSEFMYLPDQTKKRQVKPYSFLASNTSILSFQNGILTDSSSDTDSSAVPSAVIKALEQAATSAAKAFDVAQTKKAPRVYLFKVVKKDNVWGLVGAQGEAVDYSVIATH